MVNDNYLIYEDEDMQISLHPILVNYLENYYIPCIKLSNKFVKLAVPFVYNYLLKNGISIENKEKVYWGKAPIFTFGKYIEFKEPFDVFTTAQSVIVSTIGFLESENNDCYETIKDAYSFLFNEEEKMFYYKFAKPKDGVYGFLCYVNNKKIIIMFFGYEEEQESYRSDDNEE